MQLPGASALYHLLVRDGSSNRRTAVQRAQSHEDLGDAVVGKHSDLVNVAELAVGLAVEAGPEVGDEDLSPLHEANHLAVLEAVLVTETVKVLGQKVDETCCGTIGSVDELWNGATIILGRMLELPGVLKREIVVPDRELDRPPEDSLGAPEGGGSPLLCTT